MTFTSLEIAASIMAIEFALIAWIAPAVILRRQRKDDDTDVAEVESLFEEVAAEEPTRRDALTTIFATTYQLEGEELTNTVAEFVEREQAFYQVMSEVYLKRDASRLKEMPEELTKVISPWIRMTPEPTGDDAAVAELESENSALQDELDSTKRHMEALMAEYLKGYEREKVASGEQSPDEANVEEVLANASTGDAPSEPGAADAVAEEAAVAETSEPAADDDDLEFATEEPSADGAADVAVASEASGDAGEDVGAADANANDAGSNDDDDLEFTTEDEAPIASEDATADDAGTDNPKANNPGADDDDLEFTTEDEVPQASEAVAEAQSSEQPQTSQGDETGQDASGSEETPAEAPAAVIEIGEDDDELEFEAPTDETTAESVAEPEKPAADPTVIALDEDDDDVPAETTAPKTGAEDMLSQDDLDQLLAGDFPDDFDDAQSA